MRLFFILMIIAFASCQVNKTVSQGISGSVYWYEGDLMPGIDKKPVKGIPILREILIYGPTTSVDCVVYDGYFYREVKTELIKTVMSDEMGNFSVSLEPGLYTVFIKEEAGLFGNRMDERGVINPVEVEYGKLTEMEFRVDYQAAY